MASAEAWNHAIAGAKRQQNAMGGKRAGNGVSRQQETPRERSLECHSARQPENAPARSFWSVE
jgi:hypothetical protein